MNNILRIVFPLRNPNGLRPRSTQPVLMKPNRTLSLSTALLAATFSFAQGGGTARVQVIHNCADAAASTVDVWLDNTLLLDDFSFRNASAFVDAPAGTSFTVGIAGPNSMMASEAIYTEDFTLTSGETYVIVLTRVPTTTHGSAL